VYVLTYPTYSIDIRPEYRRSVYYTEHAKTERKTDHTRP
jgi:hypothetical protein